MCKRVLILQRLTNYDQTKGEDIFNLVNENICFSNYSGKTTSVFAPMTALPCWKVERDLSLSCFKKFQMC